MFFCINLSKLQLKQKINGIQRIQDKVNNKNLYSVNINDKHKYRHSEYSSFGVGIGTQEAAVISISVRKQQPKGEMV